MKKFYNYIDYLSFLNLLGFVLFFGAEPFKAPLMFKLSIIIIGVNFILGVLILMSLVRNKSSLEDFRKKILTTSFYLLLSVIMIMLWVYKFNNQS